MLSPELNNSCYTRVVGMTSGALFLAVFLACAVEAVEALTIVLAVGTVRD